MSTNFATPVQLLRSEVNNKRPDPLKLLPGQPTVNYEATQPGMFFRNQLGSLVKVGPCSVGTAAPNAAVGWPELPNPSSLGNTLGELWLDTSISADQPAPVLKVWDGSQWIRCMPYTYASVIVSDAAPALLDHLDGTLWWNSGNGLMYILYNDGTTKQWTQVSSSTVS